MLSNLTALLGLGPGQLKSQETSNESPAEDFASVFSRHDETNYQADKQLGTAPGQDDPDLDSEELKSEGSEESFNPRASGETPADPAGASDKDVETARWSERAEEGVGKNRLKPSILDSGPVNAEFNSRLVAREGPQKWESNSVFLDGESDPERPVKPVTDTREKSVPNWTSASPQQLPRKALRSEKNLVKREAVLDTHNVKRNGAERSSLKLNPFPEVVHFSESSRAVRSSAGSSENMSDFMKPPMGNSTRTSNPSVLVSEGVASGKDPDGQVPFPWSNKELAHAKQTRAYQREFSIRRGLTVPEERLKDPAPGTSKDVRGSGIATGNMYLDHLDRLKATVRADEGDESPNRREHVQQETLDSKSLPLHRIVPSSSIPLPGSFTSEIGFLANPEARDNLNVANENSISGKSPGNFRSEEANSENDDLRTAMRHESLREALRDGVSCHQSSRQPATGEMATAESVKAERLLEKTNLVEGRPLSKKNDSNATRSTWISPETPVFSKEDRSGWAMRGTVRQAVSETESGSHVALSGKTASPLLRGNSESRASEAPPPYKYGDRSPSPENIADRISKSTGIVHGAGADVDIVQGLTRQVAVGGDLKNALRSDIEPENSAAPVRTSPAVFETRLTSAHTPGDDEPKSIASILDPRRRKRDTAVSQVPPRSYAELRDEDSDDRSALRHGGDANFVADGGNETRHSDQVLQVGPLPAVSKNAHSPLSESNAGGRLSVTSPYLADLDDVFDPLELAASSAAAEPRQLPSGSSPSTISAAHRPEITHVLRQVAEAMPKLADGRLEVQMSPEELGRVRFQMIPGEHGMAVHVSADRPETLDLMRRYVDQLSRDFSDAGYESTEFSFGRGNGTGTNPDRAEDLGDQDLVHSNEPTAHVTIDESPVSDGLDIRI